MKIDREEARRIAGLAHLELDDAALGRLADEMTKILTYIDQLREVDESDTDTPVCADDTGKSACATGTPFRDDTPRPSLDRAQVERNAPAWSDGFFVVPKVIGGE